MYNFLDSKLLPKVTTSCASMDDYEVDNLINSNDLLRARGFLAYTITKPPISIDFQLICPVNIAYIYLNTTLGRQKCTGIELFMKTATGPYTSIGKAMYNSESVTFCNSRRYSKDNPPPGPCESLFFFKSNTFRLFLSAEFVRIVIFATDRSVPCIQSIQIVGTPSKTCSSTTFATIKTLINPCPNRNEKEKTVNGETKTDKLQPPEDFIDDLTCEIMALPVTLPSGKTIDLQTLDKHIKNEKEFGRNGCDPFTGLSFTNTRKPVLNVALKTRIDMYLLQNSADPRTFGTKRTLGRSDNAGKRFKLCDNFNKATECGFCDLKDNLYVLSTCAHVFCRKCLLEMKEQKCKTCNVEFLNSNVQRFHSSELKVY